MVSQFISTKQGRIAAVALASAALLALLFGADPSFAIRLHP